MTTAVRRSLTFTVIGLPAPQGSKRAFIRGGRAILVEGGSDTGHTKQADWRHAVTTTARHEHGAQPPYDGPLAVRIEFRMPRPKARRKALYADRKPDVDKLARNVLDALTNAGVIVDDSKVCDLHAVKTYTLGPDDQTSWTGATITISTLTEAA